MDIDGLRDKAEEFADEHADQIKQGIDKAEDFAKAKLDGHDEQIDQAADKLRGLVDEAATNKN
jgi:hypothetical protein